MQVILRLRHVGKAEVARGPDAIVEVMLVFFFVLVARELLVTAALAATALT